MPLTSGGTNSKGNSDDDVTPAQSRGKLGSAEAARIAPVRFRNCWRVFVLLCAVVDACAQTSHIEKAAQFLNNGDTTQAEAEARKALHTPSTRPLALAMLGTIRLQQGSTVEIVKLLEQALA